MSRALQHAAPMLKLLLVVVIIAAWVEANAQRIYIESAPAAPPSAQSLSKSDPAKAGDCSPRFDRRNVERLAPARPRVIET